MQYILSPQQLTWHGNVIQAKMLTSISSDKERDWWRQWIGQEPLSADPKLTFSVPSGISYPDNLYALTVMELYSARLIGVLREFEFKFEYFPVRLVDEISGVELTSSYFAFRLLETMACIDNERSAIIRQPNLRINKLVLSADCERANLAMFRLEEFLLTVVNSHLRSAMETEHITGCEYIPIPDFRVGLV